MGDTIEIIRNNDNNNEYLKEEIFNTRKELFELKNKISEELKKLSSTDGLRYNKINYDVLNKVKLLSEKIVSVNQNFDKKIISDEKSRRSLDTKIFKLNESLRQVILETDSNLTDIIELLETDNKNEHSEIIQNINSKINAVNETVKNLNIDIHSVISESLTNLHNLLGEKIIETNNDLIDVNNIINESIVKIENSINNCNSKLVFESEQLKNHINDVYKKLDEKTDQVSEYTKKYIESIENGQKILQEEFSKKLDQKINTESFDNFLKEYAKQNKKNNKELKDIKENFSKISANIIDKITLTEESSLNSSQIQELIIQLLEQKFNNKLEKIIIEKIEPDTKEINKIKKDIKSINSDIEKYLVNSISEIKKEFQNNLSKVDKQIQKLEKSIIDEDDLKEFVEKNKDLFKGEPGRAPKHMVQNGWLFWENPDGTWGTPIKIKSDVDEYKKNPPLNQQPYVSIIGGGGGGTNFNNYYLTKLFDVDELNFNEQGKIVSWDASSGRFKFTYKINDAGISATDLWTANKIIDYTGSVADDYIPLSEKGQPNGVATLDENGIVPTEQLPSYVDDIIEVDTYVNLPNPGETGKIYITLDDNSCYRWGGTVYVKISDEDKVPYTGADKNVDLGSNGITQEYSKFNIDVPVDTDDGKVVWDEYFRTLKMQVPKSRYDNPNPDAKMDYLFNQQLHTFAWNNTKGIHPKGAILGATLPTGAEIGVRKVPTVYAGRKILGIAGEDIRGGSYGNIVTFGKIENINTLDFIEGNPVYWDSGQGGGHGDYTQVEPTGDQEKVQIGYCIKAHETEGIILVDRRFYPFLNELSGMNGTLDTTGQIYTWNEEEGYFEVNDNLWLTAGCVEKPTITYELDKEVLTGNVILGNGVFTVYSDATGSSPLKRYEIAGATHKLTQNSRNYIIFNGNSGAVEVITDRDTPTLINQLNVIPIYTLYCMEDKGTITIYSMNWDDLSFGLSNKIADCLTRTERWRRESGILITTNSTNFTISSGYLWYGGVVRKFVDTFVSNTDTLYLWYLTGTTTWNREAITGFDNRHYNNITSGLVTLGTNKWVNNWVYRAVLDDLSEHACIVLSRTEYNKLAEALEEKAPSDIPPPFQSLGVLVGRITVQKSSTSPTVQSAWTDVFEYANVEHNELSGLQGGDETNNKYYHLTEDDYDIIVDKGFNTASGFVHTTSERIDSEAVATLVGGSAPYTLDFYIRPKAPATEFSLIANGKKFTFTNANPTNTVTITDTKRITYVFLTDSGLLQSSVNAWEIADPNVPAYIVYFNATTGAYIITDERHNYNRNRQWHKWAHQNIGAMFRNGLTGTFATSSMSVQQGSIADEDLVFDTGSTRTTTTVWWREPSPAVESMNMVRGQTAPKYVNGSSILCYDNNSGTPTTVTNNNYVANWVYATSDSVEPIYTVISQAQYTTVTLARNSVPPAINFTTAEWKLIYKVIYRRVSGTDAGAWVETIDYRTVQTGVPTSATTTDHASLIKRDVANSHPASAISYGESSTVQAELDVSVKNTSTSTDNAIAKFHEATGKYIQNSNILLNDDGSFNFSAGHIRIFGDLTGQMAEPNIIVGHSNDITVGNTNIIVGNNSLAGGSQIKRSDQPLGDTWLNSCGIAIGTGAQSLSNYTYAFGCGATAGGYDEKDMITYTLYTPYSGCLALGRNATATADNATAIGTDCVNNIANTVKLGYSTWIDGAGGNNSFYLKYDDGAGDNKEAYHYYNKFEVVDVENNLNSRLFSERMEFYNVSDSSAKDMFLEFYAEAGTTPDYTIGLASDEYFKICHYNNFTSGVSGFLMNSVEEFGIGIAPETGVKLKVGGEFEVSGGGVTLDSTELLTIGTGTLTHDGTEFVANDDVNLGSNDIQATEFRMGTNAVMKFNAISNSIDFIIN